MTVAAQADLNNYLVKSPFEGKYQCEGTNARYGVRCGRRAFVTEPFYLCPQHEDQREDVTRRLLWDVRYYRFFFEKHNREAS